MYTSSASGYNVYYNIDNNKYESTISHGGKEKDLLVAILNLEYMEQDTLYELFGHYSKDELKGLCFNIASVFGNDLSWGRYYNYSNIVVNKNLRNLLNEMTEYYKAGNTAKLEQLCNSNLGKYNDLVDIILLNYICNENIITDKYPSEIAYDMAENMNLYDAIHS